MAALENIKAKEFDVVIDDNTPSNKGRLRVTLLDSGITNKSKVDFQFGEQ